MPRQHCLVSCAAWRQSIRCKGSGSVKFQVPYSRDCEYGLWRFGEAMPVNGVDEWGWGGKVVDQLSHLFLCMPGTCGAG